MNIEAATEASMARSTEYHQTGWTRHARDLADAEHLRLWKIWMMSFSI
jgi:hypothetical protein